MSHPTLTVQRFAYTLMVFRALQEDTLAATSLRGHCEQRLRDSAAQQGWTPIDAIEWAEEPFWFVPWPADDNPAAQSDVGAHLARAVLLHGAQGPLPPPDGWHWRFHVPVVATDAWEAAHA